MEFHATHRVRELADLSSRSPLGAKGHKESPHRREEKITTAKGRLEKAQPVKRPFGTIASQVKHRMHDLRLRVDRTPLRLLGVREQAESFP